MINLFSRKKEDGILDLLDDIKRSLVEVDLVYTKPEEIDWQSISKQVSTTAYTQMGKEIYVRHVTDPKDLKFKEEKPYAKELSKVDFSKSMVLFVIFTSKSVFPSHYHNNEERILCLEGSFIGNEDEVYLKGETQIIPPGKPHLFKGITDGICLVTIGNK